MAAISSPTPSRNNSPLDWSEVAQGTSLGGTSAVSARPSARAFHGLAYDAESDRIVLFGGNERLVSGSFRSNGETWAYNVNDNTWANMAPTAAPSPRDALAMAYDEQSDRVILFGGIGPVGATDVVSNETWAYNWNANTWTNMQPAVSPPARLGARIAYDASIDRVILFGGHSLYTQYADTWSYDFESNAWTELAPPSGPSPRAFHTMTYDTESALTVLFGGQFSAATFVQFNDTWTYDGGANSWVEMSPSSSPPKRSAHAAAYDASSDRVLVFGGDPEGDDTWAYDVNANAWTMVDTPGPSARAAHDMAYDGESDRTVVFGGIWPYGIVTDPTLKRNRETWVFTWGTGSWTMVDGPVPPVPSFAVSPPSPVAGEPLTMDAAASSDPDGTIVRFEWDFGDGVSTLGVTVEHTYAVEGTYTVSLNLTDNDGLWATSTQQVVVALPPDTIQPSIAITAPSDGATVSSRTVTVTGTASDNRALQKVELSTDEVSWTLADGTTAWSGTLALEEGGNIIYVRAVDTSGNIATASISVTVSPPGFSPLLIGAVAAAIAGAAGAAVFLMRRRKRAL